ncbi:MAG TPA: hypothetical protein VMT28_06240 [Terriglobales bacterium]|jgi:hypothetical protein|nr:hypothetical protein [Terriglobales bacterium]
MRLRAIATSAVHIVFLVALVVGAQSGYFALAQAQPSGAPVPDDSPVYNAFRQLEKQPSYRIRMTLESNDPQMAQMAAMGMGLGSMETVVKGGTRQVSMHMRFPATDLPGTIDDWEIRSVAQNGRAARLITSPAVPRYLKLSEQALAMQMAMLDKQASITIAQSLANGPMGAINAGLVAGMTAMTNVEAPRLLKKEKDFFSWKCVSGAEGGAENQKTVTPLTDLRSLGDQAVEGTPATAYEFYAREEGRLQGPVRLYIAKDSGLPLRVEMTDPQGHGSMHMDYVDIGKPVDIEIPACLASGQ